MNDKQRKELSAIVSELEGLESRLADIASREQEKYDAMSESVQQSEKGDNQATLASDLSAAVDCINDAMGSIENAQPN